jgi:hypothetical protein
MRSHSLQLEKQRMEDDQREEESRQKLLEQANRGTYQPDLTYTEEDKQSILEKIAVAAEKFDKNHPASPSLEAFTAAYMFPGVFRENIKNIFGIRATPKEIGYLLELYDKEKTGKFKTKEFLIKFFALGKKIRDDKKKAVLIKQREAIKQMQKENEDKLQQLVDKTDYEIDTDYTEEDFKEAVSRMTVASEKYDKCHPAAPNLDGFTGGPVSAGAFRELMKRAFSIYLTPKEVGSMVAKFHTVNSLKHIDGKQFLIFFMKLGFDSRARHKAQVLMNQRQTQINLQQEQERKLLQSLQRVELDLSTTYTDTDREKAMAKLISAAALYDKNAPGAVSLDSFHALYLPPGMFREVMKRTFAIIFAPSELAAMIAEFNNGSGNIDTKKFLVAFVKMGTEEREKCKLLQIQKDRDNENVRKLQEKKKKQEQETKMLLKINYNFTKEQKEDAFLKLAIAAKKYDKSHPAAMALDGFDEKTMKPHVFREMLKRTFNFIPSAEELGAIVEFFDKKKIGEINSAEFLIYFLKLGIAEREKEHKESLKKLQDDAILREKLHQDKMAMQWAKAELQLELDHFTDEERAAAIEKLTEASVKFDPAAAGPMGLTAFQAKVLTPVIFREMLRRVFNMQLTNNEFASLIKEFESKEQSNAARAIDCTDFLVKFQLLGTERKNQIRAKQLEKQRYMSQRYEHEQEEMRKKLDSKMEIELDFSFSHENFENAMEKIRQLAVHYDKTHPSAPDLKGFQGADMKPNEFKDMFSRTFHVALNNKELAAVHSMFPGGKTGGEGGEKRAGSPSFLSSSVNLQRGGSVDSMESAAEAFNNSLNRIQSMQNKSAAESSNKNNNQARICNRDFLSYFYKINREEMMKRNSSRIQKEKDVKLKEKERQKGLEQKKVAELIDKLSFLPGEDENSMFLKLKEACKEYAIDSAPYIDRIQSFKGPALPPDKFRELFYQIFNVRFTFPEIGVLLSILDTTNLRVVDGSKFLNWFYKISRKLESFMLGETTEDVTYEMIKRDDMLNPGGGGGGGMTTRASTASLTSLTGSRNGGKRASFEFSWEKDKNNNTSQASLNRTSSMSSPPMGAKKKKSTVSSSFSSLPGNSSHRSVSEDNDQANLAPLNASNSFYDLQRSSPLSSAAPSPTHGKRPIQVRHSSLEASAVSPSSNSRKGPRTHNKGFASLSFSNHPTNGLSRDFDDFSVESNDTATFAKSTLSQQWFLPSITLETPFHSSSVYQSEEDNARIMREELRELFERKSDFASNDFMVLDGGTRGSTADWKKDFTQTAPSGAFQQHQQRKKTANSSSSSRGKQQNNNKSHANSTPNLVIPNAAYGSYGSLSHNNNNNNRRDSPSHHKEKPASSPNPAETNQKPVDINNNNPTDFLKSVFDLAEVRDPIFKSLPKGQDPIAKLTKISNHLHHSPAAVIAAKQQKINLLKPSNHSSSPASAFLQANMGKPSTVGGAGPSMMMMTKKQPLGMMTTSSSTVVMGSPSAHEETDDQQQQQQGGFFFPTLLSSKVSMPSSLTNNQSDVYSSEETQPILSNVPNIGIVGRSEVDPSFLKQIILS